MIKNNVEDKSYFNEIFCTSLIEEVLYLHREVERAGINLKFVNPKDISVLPSIKN